MTVYVLLVGQRCAKTGRPILRCYCGKCAVRRHDAEVEERVLGGSGAHVAGCECFRCHQPTADERDCRRTA